MNWYVPKLQETEKGKYYYCVRCQNGDSILVIEEDPSEGAKRYPAGDVLVSCHHCQTNHLFDSSEVKSLRAARDGDFGHKKPGG